MDDNLTFTDLFEELKFEIFQYLNLNERIKCRYVSREWSSILSRLLTSQETLVIGEPEFDSTDRLKLSLCNINSRHTVTTPFNTIDLVELMRDGGMDDSQKLVSQLMKSLKKLKSLFIYDPVKIKLSTVPDTIEHIHFGNNKENSIVFDKIIFPKLTCVTTIDAHLDDRYLDGITNLLKAQRIQLENVSVCEVPRSLCEELIQMPNLKQLYVFDFKSDFDLLYKEKNLEIMDAHPHLQYFNMFVCFAPGPEQICPTGNIRWLVEFGSTDKPLDRQFMIDVFNVMPFVNTLEFAKDLIHGLHIIILHDIELMRYQTRLNALNHLRLSYHGRVFTLDTLRLSLLHHLDLAPNVRNFQLRFFTHGIFEDEQWTTMIFGVVGAVAQKNSSRKILFELSAFGDASHVNLPNLPKNLNVNVKTLKEQ